MNKHYPAPMYIQIKELLLNKIKSNIYSYEQQLPSERELSKQYKVSRMTARNAITALVDEGWAFREPGKGTFVAKPKIERDLIKLSGFSQMLKEKGIEPSNLLLAIEIREANRIIATKLMLDIGEKVYEIIRLRYGNKIPIALEYTYLPENKFPNLEKYDFEKESLYEVLEYHYNLKLKYAEQNLSLARVNSYEAKILNVEYKEPILLLETLTYNIDDEPIEFTKSLTRGDNSVFYTELWYPSNT
ncbi:GntR family transcriptional regulator [Alkaliphilus peptidifermentans]|uniref:GntR family transcriptional regulator n=1 Tax=Alkaliphilus peptidifermentans DSM 18978 TaxID=1120976 RepID=A0A1G5KR90_9FIRM|nr:GntR family transcriptional regulator [Alkaliphilus peptidifermentans]SCZ03126.1 GntR family transcriptional regulator [Alkaliphilus peptidifermentans DSM 18978]